MVWKIALPHWVTPLNVAIFMTHVHKCVMGTTRVLIDNKHHGPLLYISTDILLVCFDVLRPCPQFFSHVRSFLVDSVLSRQ